MGLDLLVDYDIDKTIADNFESLRRAFRVTWSSHRCGVFGCGNTIICDGGMKPHRKVGVSICFVIYCDMHANTALH